MNILLRSQIYFILSICGLLFIQNSFAASTGSGVHPQKNWSVSDIVPGELLIKFKHRLTRSKIRAKAGRFKAHSKGGLHALGIEHWKLDASQNLQTTLETLRADPNVAFVEPNFRRYPRNLHLKGGDFPQSEARLKDLNLLKLWTIEKTDYRKSNKVKVAVIDDAFKIDHVDLSANIVLPYDVIDGGTDPSPEVCVKPGTNEPAYPADDPLYIESHGTLVMGVLGAVSGNGEGIEGAADNASVVPIRIGCNYSVSYELRAFNYAIEQGVDIINISWGGPQFSEMERLGIVDLLKRDILIVAAAGNFDADNDRVLDYPSGLDIPNILAVAAVSDSQVLLSWSQYGQTTVDIAAPGNFITTLSRSGAYVKNARGTSFSAPYIAGVAASLLARSDEQTTALDIKAAIMASAKPFSDGLKARLVTDGYVDAFAAYNVLVNPAPLPVISNIEIDDSENTGNGNGAVDPGEIVKLKITIENIGLSADSMSGILNSKTLGEGQTSFLRTAYSGEITEFDQSNFRYGSVILEFEGVDFSQYYQSQNVEFALHLSSYYGGNTAEVSRYFTIDSGSLSLDTPVTNKIRSNDDNQDEFHYYHITLDKAEKELIIKLTMEEQNSDIDLLVKYETPPQFSYGDYENPRILDRFETGTRPGVEGGSDEIVTIPNPSAGTYYIVVIADSDIKKTDMAYTLSVSASSKSFSAGAAGCSLGESDKVDPIFYILLLISFWRIYRLTGNQN